MEGDSEMKTVLSEQATSRILGPGATDSPMVMAVRMQEASSTFGDRLEKFTPELGKTYEVRLAIELCEVG
jgi:hypothetical protein